LKTADAFPADGPLAQAGDSEIEELIGDVLDAGYRHIDTAHMYHTELPIGRALASRFASGQLSRSDVWLTTKTSHPMLASYMSASEQSAYDGVIGEFAGCLERLGLEYVDALLLHWPGVQANDDETLGRSKRAEMWRAAEALYASGKARSIGVSNWTEAHLEPLLAACVEPPHLNQIECHTKQQQHELVEFCQSHDIVCTAWAPLSLSDLKHPMIVWLAAAHGVGAGDVVLRWLRQRGIVAIPKSKTPARIVSNLRAGNESSGFTLSDAEMAAIAELHEPGRKTGGDSIA